MPNATNTEQDIHIWKEGDDEHTAALYTISRGKQCICRSLPLDAAIACLREHLDEMGIDAGL